QVILPSPNRGGRHEIIGLHGLGSYCRIEPCRMCRRTVSDRQRQRQSSAAAATADREKGLKAMRLSSAIRAALIAFTVTGAGLATAAYADRGTIRFNVLKAGFVVGGSAGSGTLVFHGRLYPLAIGGVSYGFTFGASMTDFIGTVSNIRRASDVNGVYAAGGLGAAVGPAGAGAIMLTNQNGAVLTLSGHQAGLIVAADLNGLAIS